MKGSFGRFLAGVLMLVIAPHCAKGEEPLPSVDPSLIIEQFDVYNDGDLLLVPVTAFGKTRMFAVDTGSSLTAYDKSLRPFLGKPRKSVSATTPTGEVAVELFNSPGSHLGKLPLSADAPVDCSDLRELNRISGHRMEGILGMAMLVRFVVHISSDEGKLLILKRVPANAGEKFKLAWWKGIPVVEAEIAGYGSEYFQLDTGCLSGAGILRRDLAAVIEQRNLAKILITPEARAYNMSGAVESKSRRLKELRIGSHRLRDVPMDTGAEKRPSALGLAFLLRFNVTFDFPNNTLYLKKSKRFNHHESPYLGGMTFVREAADTVVDAVRERSPAAKTGIRVKDVVLKVGEQDASGARLFKLYDEFRIPGRTVRVRLLRGGEIIETEVKLPDEEEKDSVARAR